MAYERKVKDKIVGDSLDSFVENLSKAFSTQMASRNAEDELEFNRAVFESGISLEDQLAYRKEQLKRVSDDPAERKRIRNEISSLTDRVQQKEFLDEYQNKLISYESGLSSIDAVISWLETTKNSATNQTVKDQIGKELLAKQSERFTLTKQLLENQTQYAVKDKGVALIESQIAKVTSAKAKALLSGDETLASNYDLQIQALQKERDENTIARDIQNFATSSITGQSTATSLLDSYNMKISSSSATGSVNIGGVTYDSPREYWTFKRDSYVADSSSSGLFARLNDEVTTKLKVADSKSNLSTGVVSDALRSFDSLAGRPELAGYQDRLTAARQDAIQTGTNLLGNSITSRYSIDYDINRAVTELNKVKTLGGNITEPFTKLLTSAATVKSGQISNILATANDLIATGTPVDQAVAKAIAQGAGTVVSPEELATKSEKDIAGGGVSTAARNAGTVDPRTTIQPNQPTGPATPQTPATPAQQQPVQPTAPAAPNVPPQPAATTPAQQFKNITIKQGDTLTGISLRELGSASRFKELADLNKITDPNKIQAGATIKIPI